MSDETINVADVSDGSLNESSLNDDAPSVESTAPPPPATVAAPSTIATTLSNASAVKNRVRPKRSPRTLPQSIVLKRTSSTKKVKTPTTGKSFADTLLRARRMSSGRPGTPAKKRKALIDNNRVMVHANAILHNLAMKFCEAPGFVTVDAIKDDAVTYSLDKLSEALGTKDPHVVADVFRSYERALKSLFHLLGQSEEDDEPQIIGTSGPQQQRVVYVTRDDQARTGVQYATAQRTAGNNRYAPPPRYILDSTYW